jgi:hypothetical protein
MGKIQRNYMHSRLIEFETRVSKAGSVLIIAANGWAAQQSIEQGGRVRERLRDCSAANLAPYPR